MKNNFANSSHHESLPSKYTKLQNVLFAPLILNGKVVGIITLANKPEGFTERDVVMAKAFREIATVALQNSLVSSRLKEYEKIVESMDAAVTIIDIDRNYYLVNEAFLHMHDKVTRADFSMS